MIETVLQFILVKIWWNIINDAVKVKRQSDRDTKMSYCPYLLKGLPEMFFELLCGNGVYSLFWFTLRSDFSW